MNPFHEIRATSLRGAEIPFSDFAGQVALVVNTASLCGFTPQLAGLETLFRRYRGEGFVVLGFPCNQFGAQEPGAGREIAQFCELHYGVSFPLFEKVDVNGPHTHPLFALLKREQPGWLGEPIRWNFTKFLVDRHGRVLKRFAPFTKPARIAPAIVRALAAR
ncbi:MAG: glutathione peroxidase [Candidatus Dactylopiibacterium sp.]|nr:glutathione peroxidase [Candidatus Dactylopiibacterium sp.]